MPSVLQNRLVKIKEAPEVGRTSRSAGLLSGDDAFCVPFVLPLISVEAKGIFNEVCKDIDAIVARKSKWV